MKQAIKNYHKDEHNDWVAELHCGHCQHVRHNPPWINRVWVETEQGRKSKLGSELNCIKCDRGDPADI